MSSPDHGPGELSRVALPGHDAASGHPTTVILIRLTDGTWCLHVPTASHSVIFTSHDAGQLATALSPQGPATLTVAVVDHAGEVTFLHAPLSSGRGVLPPALTAALTAALVRGGGHSPRRR